MAVRFLAVVLAGLQVVACGSSLAPSRRFEVVIARQPGNVDRLPVTVIDTTGLVVHVTAEPPQVGAPFDGRAAVSNAGGPTVIALDWVGGACDERVEITVSNVGDGRLRFLVNATVPPVRCGDIGAPRSISLRFARAVPADAVEVEFPSPG